MLVGALALTGVVATAAPSMAVTNADLPNPVFKGDANPVPDTGAAYTTGNMMQSIFDADVAAGAGTDTSHDFWMDRMLARTGDGTVADLVHVDAEVPDAIGFDVTDVELSSEGDTQSVRAVPKHGDAELAGALPCSWSVGDAAVAEIASDPEDNTVTVRANGPGATTLHLQLGDLSYDVPVTVKGGQL